MTCNQYLFLLMFIWCWILIITKKVLFALLAVVNLSVLMTDWLISSFMIMLRVISELFTMSFLACPFMWSVKQSYSPTIVPLLLAVCIFKWAHYFSSCKSWSIQIVPLWTLHNPSPLFPLISNNVFRLTSFTLLISHNFFTTRSILPYIRRNIFAVLSTITLNLSNALCYSITWKSHHFSSLTHLLMHLAHSCCFCSFLTIALFYHSKALTICSSKLSMTESPFHNRKF